MSAEEQWLQKKSRRRPRVLVLYNLSPEEPAAKPEAAAEAKAEAEAEAEPEPEPQPQPEPAPEPQPEPAPEPQPEPAPEPEPEPTAEAEATDRAEGAPAAPAKAEPSLKYVGVRRGLETPADVSAVAEALDSAGYKVSVVNIEDDVDRVLAATVVERPAFVYYMVGEVDGDSTQNALVAALLDLLDIPYTGSDPLTLTTSQNRARAHLVLSDAGVPLPRYGVVRDVNAIPDTSEFRYPLIVTQTYDDIYKDEGIESPIESREELEEVVVELNKEFDLPLLIEEYIGHRRVHATLLGNRVLEVLPLTEAQLWDDDDDEDASGARRGDVRLAQLSKELADRIRQLARRAYRALECRDLAQIDFHIDEEDNPYVVDVRPLPDLDAGRPFYVAAECTEQGYDERIAQVARITSKRVGVRLPTDPADVPPAPETPATPADDPAAPAPTASAEPAPDGEPEA